LIISMHTLRVSGWIFGEPEKDMIGRRLNLGGRQVYVLTNVPQLGVQRAIVGSMRVARLAGKYAASMAAIANTTTAPARTLGSAGASPNNIDRRERETTQAAGKAMTRPATTRRSGRSARIGGRHVVIDLDPLLSLIEIKTSAVLHPPEPLRLLRKGAHMKETPL
jgi:hypothetical protein